MATDNRMVGIAPRCYGSSVLSSRKPSSCGANGSTVAEQSSSPTSCVSSEPYSLAGDAMSTAPPDWRDIPSSVRVRHSGCYALQVDGPDFQSVFVFAARPTRERNVTNQNPATPGT
jgi:hypothetical protein